MKKLRAYFNQRVPRNQGVLLIAMCVAMAFFMSKPDRPKQPPEIPPEHHQVLKSGKLIKMDPPVMKFANSPGFELRFNTNLPDDTILRLHTYRAFMVKGVRHVCDYQAVKRLVLNVRWQPEFGLPVRISHGGGERWVEILPTDFYLACKTIPNPKFGIPDFEDQITVVLESATGVSDSVQIRALPFTTDREHMPRYVPKNSL